MLQFELKETHPALGSALHIQLPAARKRGERLKLRIDYSTSPDASGIQWLEPRSLLADD
jgi:leukotriene-A4 hydrolase